MSELSDLLQLAEELNTPVLIYQESGSNFILSSVEDYKNKQSDTVDKTKATPQYFSTKEKGLDIDSVSKEDILKRINKDISIWRKKQKEENRDTRINQLKQELQQEDQVDVNQKDVNQKIEQIEATQKAQAPNYINYTESEAKDVKQTEQLEEIELEDLEKDNQQLEETKQVPYQETENGRDT